MLRTKGATRRAPLPLTARPRTPDWVVDRPRLTERLHAAVAASRLVLIAAPSGSGKTSLVSTWADGLPGSTVLLWPDLRWRGPGATRDLALRAQLSTGVASRVVVVLDVAAAGMEDHLNGELQRLMRDTDPSVRFVLLCTRRPQLDLQRLGVAGNTPSITADELAATRDEIEEILRRHGVDATASTVDAVEATTAGWACGVRFAASALERCPTTEAALRETEREITEYLDATVLPTLSAAALDLLTRTSIVEQVSTELAQAVTAGPADLPTALPADRHGFVQLGADGCFCCHPLLRRTLRRRLGRDAELTGSVATRAARWLDEQGETDLAIRVAVDAGQWAWAARRLVETLAVPRWLTAGPPPELRPAEVRSALAAAEPLVAAAVAVDEGWLETTADALDRAAETPGGPADRITATLLRMVLARCRGDAAAGLRDAERAWTQLSELSLSLRAAAPELVPLVHSHLGAFLLWRGSPERADVAFHRGARSLRARSVPSSSTAAQAAAASCLGQRAWLETLRGELTRGTRHARQVLTDRSADSSETGVVHAQLATILAQAIRGEFDEARQRLEAVVGRTDGGSDPGVAAATWLTGVRLAAAVDDPRISRDVVPLDHTVARTGWFAHQLRLARAETELDLGQPAEALRLLHDDEHPSAEGTALQARAWLDLGDLAAVSRALRTRPVEALSMIGEIQFELIEARLAQSRGDVRRQRGLIDRALRNAGREQIRTPIAWAKGWLHVAVTTDSTLLQLHGAFLASIRSSRERAVVASATRAGDADIGLSDRELEILQRLGSLSTNDEIAADLFLSTNTVKTHLKSLYRKLDVSRRSEAFRRGRALGLC